MADDEGKLTPEQQATMAATKKMLDDQADAQHKKEDQLQRLAAKRGSHLNNIAGKMDKAQRTLRRASQLLDFASGYAETGQGRKAMTAIGWAHDEVLDLAQVIQNEVKIKMLVLRTLDEEIEQLQTQFEEQAAAEDAAEDEERSETCKPICEECGRPMFWKTDDEGPARWSCDCLHGAPPPDDGEKGES